MGQYWLVMGSVPVFLLAIFLVMEALGGPLLTDHSFWLESVLSQRWSVSDCWW